MVLKNSKWDKQAKFKYLKKHGLLKPREELNDKKGHGPKWSGKNKSSIKENDDIGSDSDWSEEDEEVLNEMFPQLGSSELTKEQREKVKGQILEQLLEEQKQEELLHRKEEATKYDDGLYLGTIKQTEDEEQEDKPAPLTLEEFVSKDISTAKKVNRKLPKNKLSENLLDEYGIDSYADTLKKTQDDYNDVYLAKQQNRPLSKILTEELIDFKIGESTLNGKPRGLDRNKKADSRLLTEKEIEQGRELEKKAELAAFYRSIKKRFDTKEGNDKPPQKILEINNLNELDEDQVKKLEDRMAKAARNENKNRREYGYDDDLEELIGGSGEDYETNRLQNPLNEKNDLDSLLQGFSIKENKDKITDKTHANSKPIISKSIPPPSTDEDFLDSLLD